MGKNKDLQKMLTEFEKEFGHIKEWQIDRDERIKSYASDGGKKRGAIMGKANVESGHWQKMLVLGGQVQGKIQGKKNAESGHLDRIREVQKKSIVQFDKDGNFIKEWGSQGDAARELKLSQSKISEVCRGNRKTHGGFIFKFKNNSK